MPASFATTLASLYGADRLCVGIDPHSATLDAWGVPDTVKGMEHFGRALLDACLAEGVSVLKPQVALFERHGVAGMSALSTIIGSARESGVLIIADVKRGDIGTSLAGYADAWLGEGSDFESDAMTAVAYQGVGSLEPAFSLAARNHKGVFVLGATSNPEGWLIQSARTTDGVSVAGQVVAEVSERASRSPHSDSGWLGVVIGATVDREQLGLDDRSCEGLSLLVPGFGAQGVGLGELREKFGPIAPSVIPTVSRSVAGDDQQGLHSRLRAHRDEVNAQW